MLISLGKRFVFIANTKTASTSIEAALKRYAEIRHGGSPASKHLSILKTLERYEHIFAQSGIAPENFFKFAVMREPVDWLISWYNYRKLPSIEDPIPPSMTFEEFWRRKDWNFYSRGGVKKLQKNRFISSRGDLLLDVVVPYNDLNLFMKKIFKGLGVSAKLPLLNVSPKTVRETRIPQHIKAEIRAFYKEDYKLFESLDSINAVGMERLSERVRPHGSRLLATLAGMVKRIGPPAEK